MKPALTTVMFYSTGIEASASSDEKFDAAPFFQVSEIFFPQEFTGQLTAAASAKSKA